MTQDEYITRCEIDFIKCATLKDYDTFIKKYKHDTGNHFLEEALVIHEDMLFEKAKSIGDFKHYLKLYPLGKHAERAKMQVYSMEADKKDTIDNVTKKIENIGMVIIIIIFLASLIAMIAKGWDFGDILAGQAVLFPVYYFIGWITGITRNND